MAPVTSRSSARRPGKKSAGSSPIPCGPTCGHANCTGGTCQVRYVGPTSHLRDHHVLTAAYGTSHVWAAAVIAGLAVVLTGAIAFSGVNAESKPVSNADLLNAIQKLETRLTNVENQLNTLTSQGDASASAGVKPVATDCQTSCHGAEDDCQKVAQNGKAKLACQVEYNTCAGLCRTQ